MKKRRQGDFMKNPPFPQALCDKYHDASRINGSIQNSDGCKSITERNTWKSSRKRPMLSRIGFSFFQLLINTRGQQTIILDIADSCNKIIMSRIGFYKSPDILKRVSGDFCFLTLKHIAIKCKLSRIGFYRPRTSEKRFGVFFLTSFCKTIK